MTLVIAHLLITSKDCFLQQPEMPREVVRLPFSTGPVARISGSFSFEEGGAGVFETYSGSAGCSEKKTAFVPDIVQIVSPCIFSW